MHGRITRRHVTVLVSIVMALGVVPTFAGAEPVPTDHTVVMGAVDPALPNAAPRPPAGADRLDRFEYLAYYPDRLQVHRGDTVLFRRDGFHTVTFSPEGEPRRGFVRRDETEGVAAEDSQAPSDPTCGTPDAACVLSGPDQYLNSGWADLSVMIDVPTGSYPYYCMLHEGMEGTVEVVPDHVPVATPTQVEAQRRNEVAADTARGAELLSANQTPAFEAVGDRVRWFVKAGDITLDDRVAVLRFMPANLEIAAGDEVEFVVPGDAGPPVGRSEVAAELHTVTFPHDAVGQTFGLLRYLHPACDPDDPAAGLPGVPALYPALVTGCPSGMTFEMLFHPWAWTAPTRSPGDVVATPATVHDSGLLTRSEVACRSTCDPWTLEPFPSSSRAAFPAEGSFSYVCLVHPEWGMAGSVTVDGA